MAEVIVYGRHSRGASGGADCRKVRVRPAGGPAGLATSIWTIPGGTAPLP